MSKRRTFRPALSLALALAILSPQAALGGAALYESASVEGVAVTAAPFAGGETVAVDKAAADDTDAEGDAGAADEAGRPKRKGNAFARALGAPFRALARLFGGGSKSKAAKKTAAPAPQVTAAAAQDNSRSGGRQGGAAEESNAAEADDAPRASESASARVLEAHGAPAETPKVEPVLAPAAPTREAAQAPSASESGAQGVAGAGASQGARIIRPSEGLVAQELRPKMWIPLIVGVPADSVSQGRALLQHGYIQEAIAELQVAATNVGPQLAEANNLLGLAYDRLGWHRQAAEAYRRALTVAPKDYVVLSNLGYSLYLADDYMGALRHLKEAAKLAPSEPVIFNNLAIVHARLGRYNDAYKNFAKASNEYEAHLKLAGILEDLKRDKEAVKHYEAALRLQPGASAVLERLVAVYERTGQRDKADTARRTLGQPKNPQRTTTGGGGG